MSAGPPKDDVIGACRGLLSRCVPTLRGVALGRSDEYYRSPKREATHVRVSYSFAFSIWNSQAIPAAGGP